MNEKLSPDTVTVVKMAERYISKIKNAPINPNLEIDERLSLDNLQWMCKTIIERADEMNEGKINRWIGFIQGCLASRGVIKVDEERDVFRCMYFDELKYRGLALPETIERVVKPSISMKCNQAFGRILRGKPKRIPKILEIYK